MSPIEHDSPSMVNLQKRINGNTNIEPIPIISQPTSLLKMVNYQSRKIHISSNGESSLTRDKQINQFKYLNTRNLENKYLFSYSSVILELYESIHNLIDHAYFLNLSVLKKKPEHQELINSMMNFYNLIDHISDIKDLTEQVNLAFMIQNHDEELF